MGADDSLRPATLAYRAARDQLLALRDDPDEARRRFDFPHVGPVFNWAYDWFDVIAAGNDRPALVVVDDDGTRTTRTFSELADRSARIGAWLRAKGLGKGDPVVLMLGNEVALWETMLAAMKAEAVIVPTTTALGPDDLSDRVLRSGARAVVCGPQDTHKFDAVGVDLVRLCVGAVDGWSDVAEALDGGPVTLEHPGTGAHDPLLYYFTSGTTSRPKLVQHSHTSYPVGHLSTMYWIGLQPGDVHCNVSSPGWAKHAWSCFFAPWAAEATVLVHNATRFDPARLLDVLAGEHVTTLCAPPTVWRMLITADLSGGPWTLRELVAAGEPLNPEVITQVQRRWGRTIRDGYGQTETTASVANPPGAVVVPGSMGRPLPGVPVVLVDVVTGTPLTGPGEGELCLDLARGPVNLMTGYRSGGGAEAAGGTPGDAPADDPSMAGGFYHSGDVASVDEHGMVTFVGRTDDVFKASDYRVSPFEVESVLIEHEAVAEAAVVPAPDPLRLSVPKAYVALAPGFEPNRETAFSIFQYARAHLAPFKRVRRIEFAPLPKTISGKIRRVELRQREEERPDMPQEYREEDFPELKS